MAKIDDKEDVLINSGQVNEDEDLPFEQINLDSELLQNMMKNTNLYKLFLMALLITTSSL